MASDTNTGNHEIVLTPAATGVRFFTSTDPGSYVTAHWHRAIEIIYVQKGSLSVTVESHTRKLSAGGCILINANVIHSTKCTTPNTAIVFQIPLDFAQTYIPNVNALVFHINDTTMDQKEMTKISIFKNTLEKMQVANDLQPDGFLLVFNSLLFDILFQLYHNFSTPVLHANPNKKKKELDRLNPVLQYIAQNYNRPIPLREIADVAILQPGYFCRFFKNTMGTTFLEYQNELRLSHIYQDLIETDDPVNVILERHGFTNYKLFRRMFRETFGDTPTRIRKLKSSADLHAGGIDKHDFI